MSDEDMEIKEVDVNTAKQWMAEGPVKIVDIRSPMDYEAEHVEGAVHVQPHNFEEFVATVGKDDRIVCYCYYGNSSLSFCAAMLENGFTNVASLSGGYNAWQQAS